REELLVFRKLRLVAVDRVPDLRGVDAGVDVRGDRPARPGDAPARRPIDFHDQLAKRLLINLEIRLRQDVVIQLADAMRGALRAVLVGWISGGEDRTGR